MAPNLNATPLLLVAVESANYTMRTGGGSRPRVTSEETVS